MYTVFSNVSLLRTEPWTRGIYYCVQWLCKSLYMCLPERRKLRTNYSENIRQNCQTVTVDRDVLLVLAYHPALGKDKAILPQPITGP